MLCRTPEGGMHCQPFGDLFGNFECKAQFCLVGPGRLPGNCWKRATLCVVVLCYLVCSSPAVWQGVLTSGHLLVEEHVCFLRGFTCVLLTVEDVNLRERDFPVVHLLINLCLYIQLHWTSCSAGAVSRYLFLMFLMLFFHSSTVQASG